MARRYPGGIISATAPTVTTNSAKGVWTLSEALQYKQAGTWPGGLPGPYEYVFTPGKLYAMGNNANGQIGDNTTINRSSPVQVGSATNWKYVTTNAFTAAALNSAGQIYVWGTSASVLNLGPFTSPPPYSSPVQVGASTDWASIDMGYTQYLVGVKTNGTLWTWGYNGNGQLGLGDITNRSSPTQVGTDTNWAPFKLSAQQAQVLAIKTDGTLWAWGSGVYGQLGTGSTSDTSSPVQIGSGTNWAWVHSGYTCTFAIKDDGTLWAWGSGQDGQLGLNSVVSYSSPVQVGTGTNWRYAFGGYPNVSYAQKSDGTLWTWGAPQNGALADNQSATYRSSPVQVGSSTDWNLKYVRQCYYPGNGLRGSGSGLWVWGNNSNGELGQNNTNNYSSPVQVGTYPVNSSIRGYDDTYFITP